MSFWIFAIGLLAIPMLAICWPILTGSARERVSGVVLLLLIPLLGMLLYQYVGTPEALGIKAPVQQQQQAAAEQSPHATEPGEMDALLASLQQRMQENPDDPDGWLILGRSLKSMQRYAEAEAALANVNRLVPNNPMVMVELAETRLFASGRAEMDPQSMALIEAALEINPHQQKGLWLLGMAASQQGDDARAIGIWQKLMEQLDPASGPAETVRQQIDMARARLGSAAPEPVAAETPVEAPAEADGIPVTITVADELVASIGGNAALFIFVHPSGGAGMPLAVQRLPASGFPLSMRISDADLLRPGTSLKDFGQLDVSARISMAGTANAASGDIQANRVTVDSAAAGAVALHLDQRVP